MKLYGFYENHCRAETYSKNNVDNLLNGKSQVGHAHTWNEINDKPSTFAPSSHTHDDRYFTETEINIKLASYKVKGDFAILTGRVTAPGKGEAVLSGATNLSYPSGFSKANCIVIGLMGNNPSYNTNLTTYVHKDALGYVAGTSGIRVVLQDSLITVQIDKYDAQQPAFSCDFKLVLMKV